MSGHPITVEMLEEGHLLVIGQTRSGKTYQLRGCLEQLRRADRRVGAIDKLGNHWGLTLPREGGSENLGLDFVIFGGKRAMVPMTPDQGSLLGRLFVERSIPAIFDVSQWHSVEQQRFVADFADAVFRFNEGALHLALDEAQSWVPTNGGGPAYQAVLRLAEQGLGNGIRLLMSVQRLSRLDATVRSMAHVVVAMRQTGQIDRNAVSELVSTDGVEAKNLKRDLPALPAGTGYVWDPGSAALARHAFPENMTFDSSRTPKHGDTPPAPITATSALVDELRAAVSASGSPIVDDAIPQDSDAAFKKGSVIGGMIAERDDRVATLERDLATVRQQLDLICAAVEAFNDRMTAIWSRWNAPVDAVMGAQNELFGTLAAARLRPSERPNGPAEATIYDWHDEGQQHDVTLWTPTEAPALSGQNELRALLGLTSIYPAGLSESAWATRTGYARKGGAWIRRRKRYLDSGFIEQRDGRWFATAKGIDQAGTDIPAMPPPGGQLVSWWAERLGAPGRLLKVLAATHPRGLTREGLAAEAGMSKAGGAFIRHVSALKAADLVIESGKRLTISSALLAQRAPPQ